MNSLRGQVLCQTGIGEIKSPHPLSPKKERVMFVENYRLDLMIGGQAQSALPYPKISDKDWRCGGRDFRHRLPWNVVSEESFVQKSDRLSINADDKWTGKT